jgi:dolichyl-phosphate mannosyltransferase polypeptide 2 regulatory subunit
MLVASSVVFLYYTIWTLLMVSPLPTLLYPSFTRPAPFPTSHLQLQPIKKTLTPFSSQKQPFVDSDHPLQNFFPPRVWAIRIPVILVLLGCAVVGSFLSVVMIRSNRKKAAKAAKAAAASAGGAGAEGKKKA